MMLSSVRLLQLALPLVKNHGFTRDALARSVMALPLSEAHTEPLSETSVSALFGSGDSSRRNLIKAWLDDGIRYMDTMPPGSSVNEVLRARLEYNEPVLQFLPEAFALLASPQSGLPPLDLRPALQHASTIADKACRITGDKSLQLAWYTRRMSLATIYSVSELHQLTSPDTAYTFLETLLHSSVSFKSSLNEVDLFSSYIVKSWRGIINSYGIL
ncbi:hypothetical protein BDZ94DRAFT_1274874 [Collybia nuda]|uniref:Ubiquinone biosynthesis protein n=1 Tax=Collybia nuda TaxID=64659 RepID=A0A9P6CD85_9AGAR|nr:hypothetical protein BDZ94DRAFT_1274874 [Collybia nuda]